MNKKRILVIIDGLEENSHEYLVDSIKDNIKYTSISIDEKIIKTGVDGFKTESLICILNILGYSAKKYSIYERAFFEALARGYTNLENKTILRCNIVKICNDRLIDFTGGVDKELGKFLIDKVTDTIIDIRHCSSYKNLIFLNESYQYIKEIQLPPPHFSIGEIIKSAENRNVITDIMEHSKKLFKSLGYKDLMLWLWGASKKTTLPSFYEKYGLKGAVVSGIDLVKGIGNVLEMEVPIVDELTGDIDTNLESKLEVTLKLLEEKDFILLHINGCDEAAHRKKYDEKIMFFNKINKIVIEPLLSILDNTFDIVIGSDHITNSYTGKHFDGHVKFLHFKIK